MTKQEAQQPSKIIYDLVLSFEEHICNSNGIGLKCSECIFNSIESQECNLSIIKKNYKKLYIDKENINEQTT